MIKTLYAALAAFAVTVAAGSALAQLNAFEDYDISDAVWEISTVKVDANMGDYYLEGLKQTWIASNEVAKKLGHIEDYFVFSSITPESGEFNMMLVVKLSKTADLAPSKEKYDAFMKAWSKKQMDESRKTSMELYPKIRKVTGDYVMRRIMVK